MARFRRGNSLNPVNSIKHVLDAGGGLTSTSSNVPIATAVANVGTTFVPGDIRVGATINGLFLTVNIIGATGQGVTGPVDWYIIKLHSGQAGVLPTPGNTGISTIRNQIIHEEKGVPGSADGTPHIFKGVVVIPRGMRRMREGDTINVVLKMTDPDAGTFCVKSIYKSFF